MMQSHLLLSQGDFTAHTRDSLRGATNARGQALVELGIVIMLFMMLSLGIVEFGRILMITNVITHAARDGARAAAVAERDPNTGALINEQAIEDVVRQQIRNVLSPPEVDALSVDINPGSTPAGIPTMTVQVTGAVPYLFAGFLFGGSDELTIDRTVTFRDERR